MAEGVGARPARSDTERLRPHPRSPSTQGVNLAARDAQRVQRMCQTLSGQPGKSRRQSRADRNTHAIRRLCRSFGEMVFGESRGASSQRLRA